MSSGTSGTIRSSSKNSSRPKLIHYIEENIIGKDQIFKGPWGPRRGKYFRLTFVRPY